MRIARISLLVSAIVSTFAIVATPLSAGALSGSNFKPGRIIDDAIFTNKNSMSIAQIQTFLNAKVSTCEVNHVAYNASNPPPYTCLKDYQENPTTGANNFGKFTNGVPSTVPGGKTAAMMIWDAAQTYNINPQVLIVLLQKEQALVTDTWPLMSQYTKAAGYLCPDTAACNSNAGGFSKQVFGAAWQFRNDFNGIDTPNFFSVYGKGVNNIRLSPDINCGTKSVNIENQATAVLYKYTPYTPNAAALANLNGLGDNCSAYGNRNFWRYFTEWFGSTTAFNASISLTKSLTITSENPAQMHSPIMASFEVSNSADYPVVVGGLGICARLNGYNFDFGFDDSVTLQAHQSLTISKSRQMNEPGTLRVFVCSYNDGLGGWASDVYPYLLNGALTREVQLRILDNPLISAGISLTPSSPAIGQPVTATMTLRNAGTNAINVGSMVIAARSPSGANVDFGIVNDVYVPAGGTYAYSKTQTFSTPGAYNLYIANWNGSWSTTYPKSADSTIVRALKINF